MPRGAIILNPSASRAARLIVTSRGMPPRVEVTSAHPDRDQAIGSRMQCDVIEHDVSSVICHQSAADHSNRIASICSSIRAPRVDGIDTYSVELAALPADADAKPQAAAAQQVDLGCLLRRECRRSQRQQRHPGVQFDVVR